MVTFQTVTSRSSCLDSVADGLAWQRQYYCSTKLQYSMVSHLHTLLWPITLKDKKYFLQCCLRVGRWNDLAICTVCLFRNLRVFHVQMPRFFHRKSLFELLALGHQGYRVSYEQFSPCQSHFHVSFFYQPDMQTWLTVLIKSCIWDVVVG